MLKETLRTSEMVCCTYQATNSGKHEWLKVNNFSLALARSM